MARLDDWQNNLSALIERRRGTPGQFGAFDCCLWGFEGIEAVRGDGEALYAPFRGQYDSAETAVKALRRIGKAKTPFDWFVANVGEPQPVGLARKGDIVFAKPDDELLSIADESKRFGLVPGLCYGHFSYFVGEADFVEIETYRLESCIWVS